MLDRVEQIESSGRQRPADGRTGELSAALRALAFATSDDAAEDAYHRVLFAVGNNHRGSYFPIVLDAIPFLGEILAGGDRSARARTIDVLIDLVGSFEPDPDVVIQDGIRPEDLPALLRAGVEELRPSLQILAADSSAPDVQRLARELLDCLAEGAAQPGVAPDGACAPALHTFRMESESDGAILGHFDAGPDYADVVVLFTDFAERVEQVSLSGIDEVVDRIEALEVRAIGGNSEARIYDLQIYGDGASLRIQHSIR